MMIEHPPRIVKTVLSRVFFILIAKKPRVAAFPLPLLKIPLLPVEKIHWVAHGLSP
jgi:hypothetical protein